VTIPETGAEGAIVANGGPDGGFVLCIHDGRAYYVSNYLGREVTVVGSPIEVPSGRVTIEVQFSRTADHAGRVTLAVGDAASEPVDITRTNPATYDFRGAGLTVGSDEGRVWSVYAPPFAFTAQIHQVTIVRDGNEHRDPAAELRVALSEQ
jgi:arylsulfatase